MRINRILAFCGVGFTGLLLLVSHSQAYPTYQSEEDAADNCSACHSGFGGPSGSLHGLHTGAVDECTACHTSPGSTPVQMKFEPGSPGCSGCHVLDGLVTHHTNAGAPPDGNGFACATCHSSVSPGRESDPPPYYPGGSAPLTSVTLDPCDGSEELGSTNTVSLDNDGDLLYDMADPDCAAPVAEDCFNGIDDDLDELIDCADPDCDGAAGESTTCGVGACADNTGQIECQNGVEMDTCDPFGGAAADDATCDGIDDDCDEVLDEDYISTPTTCGVGECSAEGFLECVDDEELDSCLPGDPGPEGPIGDTSCGDGLDNDCDGSVDLDDPDCEAAAESDCFDGLDNDLDELIDCVDPDCEGATSGPCDTGEPGVCAEGTYVCSNGEQICRYNSEPQPEGNMYNNCNDGLDNDCDGFADIDDTSCDMMLADVWLVKLIAHNKVNLKVGESKGRHVFAFARADTKSQEATVMLTVEAPEGVTVRLDPDTVTQPIDPFGETNQDDESSDDESSETEGNTPLFKFFPVITCDEPGAFTITYVAEVTAPENRTPEGDVVTATSVIKCRTRPKWGYSHRWSGRNRVPR